MKHKKYLLAATTTIAIGVIAVLVIVGSAAFKNAPAQVLKTPALSDSKTALGLGTTGELLATNTKTTSDDGASTVIMDDVCPNVPGTQTAAMGYYIFNGRCLRRLVGDTIPVTDSKTTQPPTNKVETTQPHVVIDLCPNIAGTQITVPSDYRLENGQCVPDTMCMVMMGGVRVKDYLNDVWSFDAPGNSWAQRMAHAPWIGRAFGQGVFFNGKVWFMGGVSDEHWTPADLHNDVWSFDGTTWHQEPDAPWAPRARFGAVVFQNKVWVMGGDIMGNYPYSNEVWSSFMGLIWARVDNNLSVSGVQNAPWTERIDFSANVVGNSVYIMGGKTTNAGNDPGLKQVWLFNGTTWVSHGLAPWTERSGQVAVTVPCSGFTP